MTDLRRLSASKLQELAAKREAASSANCSAFIAAGRGYERSSEIRAKAAIGDDQLASEYVRLTDLVNECNNEIKARYAWHGSMKPIRRRP